MKARIRKTTDYITIGPIGSRDAVLTAWRDVCGLGVNAGCFVGTLEEFEKAVKKKHGTNRHAKEYAMAIAIIKLRAKSWDAITDEEKMDVAKAVPQ